MARSNVGSKAPRYKGAGPVNPFKGILGKFATLWPSGPGGLRPGQWFESLSGREYLVGADGNFIWTKR